MLLSRRTPGNVRFRISCQNWRIVALAVQSANLTLPAVRRANTAPRLPRRRINKDIWWVVRPDALDLFAFAAIVEMAEDAN